MTKRVLLDGSELDELDAAISLIIYTKVPKKWKIIDMETGQEYIGSDIPHASYCEVLREKVTNGKVGSWEKTKWKDIK